MEALVAFVILAGGLMALFRFHNTNMESTADSKIRAQAIAQAEAKLEEVRSYLTEAEYTTRMTNGTDSITFTNVVLARTWVVDTSVTPSSIEVTVAWIDREGNSDDIKLETQVRKENPTTGPRKFTEALAGGDPAGPWVDTPIPGGTGEGTGTVAISPVYDGYGNPYNYPDAIAPATYYYYDITFTGSIEATDDGLDAVAISGAPNSGAAFCDPPTGTPGNADYEYTCYIKGIPDGDTWNGSVTYDPAGNDAVCIPDGGTVSLSFNQQSPADLQLGIVVLTNNGACNAL
ncbi:MAG: hypothetical protein JKY48_01980 [Flavobacteriales bacterium]|nr:hypothetical protein [Flavobacteriales bacterium]